MFAHNNELQAVLQINLGIERRQAVNEEEKTTRNQGNIVGWFCCYLKPGCLNRKS